MQVEGAPQRLQRLPSWLLGQLNAQARRTLDGVFAAHKLNRSQYALLAALEQFGPQSQAALSERSGLDRSDVVRWVDELVARRLARRDRDAHDRRRNIVSINAAGTRLLDRLDIEILDAQQRVLSALNAAERRQLVALLGKAVGVSDGTAPVIADHRWH